MNKTVKQIALFMLIGLILMAIFQINQKDGETNNINYSDFMKRVQNKQVTRVVIENNKKISNYIFFVILKIVIFHNNDDLSLLTLNPAFLYKPIAI